MVISPFQLQVFPQAYRPLLPGAASQPVGVVDQPPITPEEEQSLLGRGLSALEYLALTLDKPGAAARGMLSGAAGGPWGGGLLNLVPFSDSLGLTDPEERVWGRDLLTTAGIAPENKPGLAAWLEDPGEIGWDVAGFATEVLTDPLNMLYGPAKALTRAGKAAAKQGKGFAEAARLAASGADDAAQQAFARAADEATAALADPAAAGTRLLGDVSGSPAQMLQEIDEGLRAPLAVGAPWPLNYLLPGTKPIMTGPVGRKIGKAALDNAYYNKFSPVFWWRSAFSPAQRNINPFGATAPEADRIYHEVQQRLLNLGEMKPFLDRRHQEFVDLYADAVGPYLRMGGANQGASTLDDLGRWIAEHQNPGQDVDHLLGMFRGGNQGQIREFLEGYQGVLQRMQGMMKAAYTRNLGMGLRGGMLDDIFLEYFPRRPTNKVQAAAWDALQERMSSLHGKPFSNAMRRRLRNFPGGTAMLNDMALDKRIVGTSKFWVKHDPVGAAKSGIEGMETAAKFKRGTPVATNASVSRPLEGRVLGTQGDIVIVDTGTGVVAMPSGSLQQTANSTVAPLASADDLRASIDDWWMQNQPRWVTPPSPNDGLKVAQRKYVAERHLGPMIEQELANPMLDQARRTELTELLKNPEALEEMAGTLGEYYAKHGPAMLVTGHFNRGMIGDFYDYMEHLAITESHLRNLHNFVRGVADHASNLPDDAVPLDIAFASVRNQAAEPAYDMKNALLHFAREFEQTERGKALGFRAPGSDLTEAEVRKVLADSGIAIPRPAAKVMERMHKLHTKEGENFMRNTWDKVTAVWKSSMTSLWPAFHVRNLIDGQWRWWVEAGDDTFRMKDYNQAFAELGAYMTGKSDTLPYMDEVRSLFAEMIGTHGQHADILEDYARMGGRTAQELPAPGQLGRVFEPLYRRSEAAPTFLQRWNPFRVGGGLIEEGAKQWSPAEVGTRAYEAVEMMNRIPAYIAMRRNGMSPGQAMAKVLQVQFDYAQQSPLSRKWMRRAVPFWSFVSKNIPYQLSTLFNRPGGRAAQTLRLMNAMLNDDDQFKPWWVRERGGVTIGRDEEGNSQIVLSPLGSISLQDAFANVAMTGSGLPNLARTMQRYASQLHPAITAPLKIISNRDLYTGRELKHVSPVVSETIEGMTGADVLLPGYLETMLSSLPGYRGVTTAHSIVGEGNEKPAWQDALNLLTMLKITTVDPEKWRHLEIKKQLEELLEQDPRVREYTRPYIPAEDRAKADPVSLRALSLLADENKALAERAKRELLKEQLKERGVPLPDSWK